MVKRRRRKSVNLRGVRRAISRFLVLALLFSQLAMAAYACPLPANAPMVASAPETNCCGGMPSPLCSANCAQGAQAQDRGHPPQFISPAFFVLVSRAAPLVAIGDVSWPAHRARSLPPPGPEPSRLHSRLRI